MPNTKNPEVKFHTIDTLLYSYLRNQRLSTTHRPSEPSDNVTVDSSASADAYVLGRELEHWMFETPEGRCWVSKRLHPVKQDRVDETG